MPTERLLLLLAAAAPLFLLHAAAALAVDAVLLLAAAADALRALRTAMQAARDAPARLPLGGEAPVTLSVRSSADRAVRLRITDDLHPALERLGAEEHARTLPPRGRAEAGYRVRATTRGPALLGDLHLRVLGPWGLAWARHHVAQPWRVGIYPGVLEVRRYRLLGLRHRLQDAGLRNVRRRGEGGSFESLREYARGDDPRALDWKASARRGTLMLRQFEAERNQNLVLAIDAGRLMTERIGERERIDSALSSALLLADVARGYGDRVGVFVFADRVEQFLPPGRVSLPRIAELLSEVEPRLVEPNYPAAFAHLRRQLSRRSLIVWFTDVGDAAVSAPLVTHLQQLARRHLPLVLALRNPELDRLADAPAQSEAGVYRRAAAEELLQARAQTVAALRRAGVLVADARPGEAAPAVVNQYLTVKRQQLL